jgi:hypothetical protein
MKLVPSARTSLDPAAAVVAAAVEITSGVGEIIKAGNFPADESAGFRKSIGCSDPVGRKTLCRM